MCLAIGHKDYAHRGILARQWWKIASNPIRLFIFSALFHSAVLLMLLQLDTVSLQQLKLSSSMPVLLIAILGGLMLGVLFEKVPAILATSAIDYNVFGASYNLTFLGLILLEFSWFFYSFLSVVATVMLLLAWIIAVRAFYWSQQWAKRCPVWLVSSFMWSLYAVSAMLALILLAQLAQLSSVFHLLSVFSLVLLFSLLLQFLLLLKLRD
ncbi:MAG: hypothetical protein ACN4GM_06080 [Gammaproteobacteria bacterium]